MLKQSKHWLLLFPAPGIYLPKLVCSVKMFTCSEEEAATAGNMGLLLGCRVTQVSCRLLFLFKWVLLKSESVLAGMFGMLDLVQSLVFSLLALCTRKIRIQMSGSWFTSLRLKTMCSSWWTFCTCFEEVIREFWIETCFKMLKAVVLVKSRPSPIAGV